LNPVGFEKLKLSTRELKAACAKWRMKINAANCQTFSASQEPISINGFVFLINSISGSDAGQK